MPLRSLKELDPSQGTVKLHTSGSNKHVLLHPQPNALDPNDPLRWPRWKKHLAFGSVCGFTFFTNYGIGGLAPAFYTLSLQFKKTQTETSALLLWPVLTLGVFNFFWVPMANYFGKRPIFVFASLLLAVCFLWGALAQSFKSLLWSNIIAAFAGSATEAVGAATVNDLYFLHERGNYMAWYMNAINGGNTIGPLICGFVVESLGWRWHKWIAFILAGVNWLVIVFFLPETSYANRALEQSSDLPSAGDPAASSGDDVTEKDDLETDFASIGEQRERVPRKSYLQTLSLWNGVPSISLPLLFVRPMPLIVYPAVIFSFLGYAVSLAWVVAINILNSFVLQAPPYSFSASINGLINIAGLIGNLAGAFLGGWVVDRYSDWRSKTNNGVFQPETRLHLLIIPGLIVPAGCLAFGFGVAVTLHWTALFFGYGMISVGLTFVPVATMTYVSDCYLPVNADALLLVNGLKNIVAFGFLYGVIPWVTSAGYIDAFGTQAGVYVAIITLAIPLSIWGAKLRYWSAGWKVIL